MDTLWQDLRYAIRSLVRHPGFAAIAALTLALGIGANTAIFSVVDGVLLEPLPFPGSERIVALWEVNDEGGRMHLAAPNFVDFKAESRSLEALAVHSSPDFGGYSTVLGGEEAILARVTAVSADFFRALGVRPERGRAFTSEELEPGGAGAVVVSHRFWRDQLGSTTDPGGRTLNVWGELRQVVGVMPPGFDYPGDSDLWVPVRSFEGESRGAHNWAAVGRLGEGVSLERARMELDGITRRIRRQHGEDVHAASAAVVPLREQLVGDLRQPLWLLLGAAGFVLLVACTNLASMLLARGTARQREIAVRASLGAGRPRLVRQLFTESMLLALLGSAAGLVLAYGLLRSLGVLAPSLPRIGEIGIDGGVLLFTLGLAGLTAALFGLFPALRTTGSAAADALRSGNRGGTDTHRRGPWSLLVGGEVALALLLLVGSGLLMKSFREVTSVDPGFRAENVLTVDLSLPESEYPDDDDMAGYFRRLLEEIGTLPGVEAAGLVNHLPLGGVAWSGDFIAEGRGRPDVYPDYRIASPGYFEALGIPLLRGRRFEDRDRRDAPHVVLVSQSLAERVWPGEDPVGRRIRDLANEPVKYRGAGDWLTVVGVVGDVRHHGLTADARPTVYVNALQHPDRARSAVVAIRSSVPPERLVGPVRTRVRSIDPDVPAELVTFEARLADSVADRRFSLFVLGLFAAVALLLAAVGIYGVVAYSVERRRREMGIRLALGALPSGVLGRVVGDSIRVAAVGIALGVAGAMALTRVLRGMLYEVSPLDPAVFAAVVAVLTVVALIASYVPARRAAGVDPIIVLRAE